MNSKEREELVKKVAERWKKGGIKRLKEFGNFQKYTPLFHFHISEPYNLKQNFIYITELFGHITQSPEDAGVMNFVGMRRQLQGNYDGLQKIILQGISEPNILPYETTNINGERIIRPNTSPAQKIGEIKPSEFYLFDNALLYFENITRHLIPKTFHLDLNSETFSQSHTFY